MYTEGLQFDPGLNQRRRWRLLPFWSTSNPIPSTAFVKLWLLQALYGHNLLHHWNMYIVTVTLSLPLLKRIVNCHGDFGCYWNKIYKQRRRKNKFIHYQWNCREEGKKRAWLGIEPRTSSKSNTQRKNHATRPSGLMFFNRLFCIYFICEEKIYFTFQQFKHLFQVDAVVAWHCERALHMLCQC